MRLGKQMQFFGARVNLAKALLYAINGGRDEISGEQIAPPTPPITSEVLDYDEVMSRFDQTMEWLARTYVHAMNCIHYMHDKYFYERLEMALHDRDVLRTMAFGIAGLSVVADSLAAVKYAKVHVIRDATGLAVDYRIEMDGAPVTIHSPIDARQLGIETVYQDLALFDNLGPSDNFYAGRELASPRWLPRSLRVIRRSKMSAATGEVLNRLQVVLPDPNCMVGLMSGGQRQAVAVSRAAAFATNVVVLDEPTAALGVRESRKVLDLIIRLREEGMAIIVVSHAMDHVIEVADRAVVLRRGRKVGELVPSAETHQEIVSLIVGGVD